MSHNDSSFTCTTSLRQGTCTLVGAGPGDPELLTLKAVKAIQAATVLLVDDLVNEEVLKHASGAARIVYVGKRGGCKSTPQARRALSMWANAAAAKARPKPSSKS